MAGPDDETLIECRACGGHWKLRNGVTCKWCKYGMMNMPQLLKWRDHKSGTYERVIPTVPTGATGG